MPLSPPLPVGAFQHCLAICPQQMLTEFWQRAIRELSSDPETAPSFYYCRASAYALGTFMLCVSEISIGLRQPFRSSASRAVESSYRCHKKWGTHCCTTWQCVQPWSQITSFYE